MTSVDADLVIAGAGAAGLGALQRVLDRQLNGCRIVVIDADFTARDDRTWGFWGDRHTPFADIADDRWGRVGVNFPAWSSTQRLDDGRRYHRLRESTFRSRVLCDASRRGCHIEFVERGIDAISEADGFGTVHLDDGSEVRADTVLQSVCLAPHDRAVTIRHPLRQHFVGWEVRTEHPVFDPATVTLMDFDTDQFDASAFFYTLPVARDRALVEHTMFSVDVRPAEFHEEQIRRHLDRLGAGWFEIERRERGVIPMQEHRPSQRWGRHVWNVGSVGGMTKPTTGYTFVRTQRQVGHLIDAWAAGAAPTPVPDSPRRFGVADRVLLNILHRTPDRGRPIFERLFRTTPIDAVLTFLDEESSIRDDARMIARLPWAPFVNAAVREAVAEVAATSRSRR